MRILRDEMGREYRGRTLRAIWRRMCRELSVAGSRSLAVADSWEDCGQTAVYPLIRASLYDGDDAIVSRDGRILMGSHNSRATWGRVL